ncbi:MAG: HEAT repeat domain-containing protein, partial [Anaerolineae bacterium]
QRLAELLADPAAPSTGRGAAADVLGEIGDAAIEATRPLLWHRDGKTRTLAAEVLAEIGWKPREDEEAAAYWVAKREWDTCVDLGSAAVRPLTMVLQENDPEVREKAAGQLGALGSPQVVEPLSRALRDAEWKVRAAAARSLGKLGDERAVETLTAALEDESKTVQREAVIALGKLGHADTVEPLTAALQLDSSSVRKAAVQALTRIGDPRAFEALITALENDAGAVDATVLDELVKMDDPRVMETLVRKATKTSGASVSWSARETYVEALGTMGQPAIDALAAVLGSGGSTARQYAAIALGEIGDRRAVKPLLLALVDSYTATRNAAADALDEIGWKPDRGRGGAAYWIAKEEWDKCVEIGQPAAGPLISALRVTKWRGGAATALRSLKWGPDAGEALAEHRDTMVRLLKESDQSRVPDAAVHVLEAIGWEPDEGEAGGAYWAVKEDWDRCVAIGQPAVPALTRALGWTSPVLDLSLRRKIVGALSRIGDPALEWLREAVCNDTASMRAAAARALGALADPRAAEPLIAALDDESDEVRRRAARALVEVPDSRAVEPLMTALKDEDEDVRENAMDALGAIGDARALKPVAAALKNRNRQREKTLPSVLRRSAAQVLGELGDERAVGPLMEALDDFDQVVVGNAAVSLAKLGVSDAVEPLLRLLADEDRWFPARAGAAEALGILGDPRAVDALKAALHDEADSVCEKASEALERIKTGPPAVPCAFCGKELHEGAGVRTMSGGGDDPFAAMQEAAQQMLARKVVCSSCGAVFCLECGNAVGVERGTGKTHCPDCGKAVPSSQLM